MTATGSERCTATPWRGSGRGFGTSSGRSGVSTKRTENSTSSFSRGLTTSRRSPTSSCGYCSDAREPPNWLHEPTADIGSQARPHGALDGQRERLGALAADQEAGAIGEVQADAAVAPGVEDALAVAARADAPAPVVGQGPVADDLQALDRADRDDAAVGGDPAEPDAGHE